MQTKPQEQLSLNDATLIVERLPTRIQDALVAHANEIEIQSKLSLKWPLPASLILKH